MVAMHPPFTKAVAGDKFYKPIGSGRPELFWQVMEKYKSPNYYSDDFKDLVNQMLALKDDQRIKMDGILDHPWL